LILQACYAPGSLEILQDGRRTELREDHIPQILTALPNAAISLSSSPWMAHSIE
jgi:hypothetical protein